MSCIQITARNDDVWTAKTSPDADIQEVCREALQVASTEGVTIDLEYQGVNFSVFPNDSLVPLEDVIRREMRLVSLKSQTGFSALAEALGKVVETIQQQFDRDVPSVVTGNATGFADLDLITSGLQPGDMIVIAGRPSTGKTALGQSISEHMAIDKKLPIAIFSMELSSTQLAMRSLSRQARIDQFKIRTGRLNDSEWDAMTAALGRLHDAPIYVMDDRKLDIRDIAARAERLSEEVGQLGLILIDSIHLVAPDKESDTRAVDLAETCRQVKVLAQHLNVPIVVTAPLSRKCEDRTDKRPILSDIRDAGGIEDTADIVMMMYRDELYYRETPDRGIAEVSLKKNRNGPTGMVKLAFVEEYGSFSNLISI